MRSSITHTLLTHVCDRHGAYTSLATFADNLNETADHSQCLLRNDTYWLGSALKAAGIHHTRCSACEDRSSVTSVC